MSVLNTWSHRLCFDIALELDDLPTILQRHGVDATEFEHLMETPAFLKQVLAHKQEIRDNGVSFKAKAKIQAEDNLDTAYKIIHNPDTPAAVKADLIKWTAKMAGYEVPEKTQDIPTFGNVLDQMRALSDGELEVRVTQIVSRRAPEQAVVAGETYEHAALTKP